MTEVKVPIKKRKKRKDDEAVNCYFCDKLIVNSNDLVIKKVPMATPKGGVRNYKRQLHLDCVSKYNEGLENVELRAVENDEWDKVYVYFRDTILGLPAGTKLEDKNSHLAKRLLGLRLGQYIPSGTNTRILPRGYSFNTILITLKVVNPKLQPYLKSTNFVDFKHKIDGCMRFVVSEIADVAKRIETQHKANTKLEEEVVETPAFDYKAELLKQKQKKKEESNNSVADDIASLLGGSL